MGIDAILTSCRFCWRNQGIKTPATLLAPQLDGGDEDQPIIYVPICNDHSEGWYVDIGPHNQLPMIPFQGA